MTPELLAATGARYSRNNEGLDSILAKIDPANPDKSVDSIFRMVDYGHQSIADMAPVAIFIDGVSVWLAYFIWSICPTASGQESSTRYIRLNSDGVLDPADAGIPVDARAAWQHNLESAFSAYSRALNFWEAAASRDPQIVAIPESILNDESEKGKRKIARMRRNFAFDRARYFLPAAAKTNVMLLMSARSWVQLCQMLLSHYLCEARRLGSLLREELEMWVPRLTKHASEIRSISLGLRDEYDSCMQSARSLKFCDAGDIVENTAKAFLEIHPPAGVTDSDIGRALEGHNNIYAWMGSPLRRTLVRFGWDAVSFAEIRDLNRHRTGTKTCQFIPRGFYAAAGELNPSLDKDEYDKLGRTGAALTYDSLARLQADDPAYVYWCLLGSQMSFEHATTGDKFVYEAELRTGAGAHFRYAQHLRDVLALWYARFPSTKGSILEGANEPE
ncbi:MAG: FAD-dependent thymidylate synthase [Candidatus Hydrogenedentes bacterium]|nr:FAD-dependent thymidylate synthase [Candidatus Hydrogenedentota bacterium]